VITNQIVAIDTGGTFTDVVAIDVSGRVLSSTKVPTTPEDPADGIEIGLREVTNGSVDALLYGTTTATNALLQRKGARTALLTTSGFRDLLQLRRQNRPSLYDWFATMPPPLVPRDRCFEISERIAPAPESRRPLDESQARLVVEQVRASSVQSVAISLLHSYKDGSHEQRLAEIINEVLPDIDVSISSEILPEIMEFERTSTTVANAYLSPIMKDHLRRLVPRLRAGGWLAPLYLMQSNGGLGSAEVAAERAVQTVLSGPAAGVVGGVAATGRSSKSNFLTIDMGGTSFDVAYVANGTAAVSRETTVAGLPLAVPSLDIHTLGAGGGSVAWVDPGGVMRVGPSSAGSRPGPACYGRGGQLPTVTDANLLLGRLGGDLLGGRLQLDRDAAAHAVERHLARPLGIDVIDAARGVVTVVNAAMAKGMYLMSVARGRDPRSLAVVGFGGAGPLHACELATAIGCDEVVIPALPGTTSAIGLALAPVRRDATQSVLAPLRHLDTGFITSVFSDLGYRVMTDLVLQGISADEVRFDAFGRFCYEGQRYQIDVPIPSSEHWAPGERLSGNFDSVIATFEIIHSARYGYIRPEPLVVFSLGVTGTAPPTASRLTTVRLADSGHPPVSASRQGHRERLVWFGTDSYRAVVADRAELVPGESLHGPAVIEQADSTTVLPPGWAGEADVHGNLILRSLS